MLLETIKCKNGKLHNLEYHQSRLNVARIKYFSNEAKIHLSNQIQIPEDYKKGLFRCRVLYSDVIEKIEFLPHEIRNIKCLKLIENDDINYQHKYTDRTSLQLLFEQRGDCDDVIIVKNGCITDTFTANIIFYDGEKWWTPDTPLLPGTQRTNLIEKGKISVCRITINDLSKYQKVALINALQNMDDMPVLPIDQIKGID